MYFKLLAITWLNGRLVSIGYYVPVIKPGRGQTNFASRTGDLEPTLPSLRVQRRRYSQCSSGMLGKTDVNRFRQTAAEAAGIAQFIVAVNAHDGSNSRQIHNLRPCTYRYTLRSAADCVIVVVAVASTDWPTATPMHRTIPQYPTRSRFERPPGCARDVQFGRPQQTETDQRLARYYFTAAIQRN